ncbi:hypothetical protein [Gulosibacter sp. 10]|uniref:hypothetical protein n=1 Tax=Gulosibacter sp. 10 TaxID=1255570 RepID=UPI00097F0445|nr:hypothetical protein [Gulosibacter sp. 10]SJM60382.1 hypothetical protein FM112_07130 [Gulosibacter sp. 10]
MPGTTPFSPVPPHRWAASIRGTFLDLAERRDWRRLREFVATNWIEIWFAIPAHEIEALLADLPHSVFASSSGGTSLLGMLFENASSGAGREAAPTSTPAFETALIAIGDRVDGDPVRSYRRFRVIIRAMSSQQREAKNLAGRYASALLHQAALSALLAGDFETADLWLARVRASTRVEPLPFVQRDAASVRALMHAAFGSLSIAEHELAFAEHRPRTDAWSEAIVDATIVFARRAIEIRKGTWDRSTDILALPWWQVQPHWPVAVWSIATALLGLGDVQGLRRLIDAIDTSRLTASASSGLPRSVLPAVRVLLAHVQGERPQP